MTDYLASLPVDQVAAWYRRLADRVARERVGGEEPYASMLLKHYLDNRDTRSQFTIPARSYLQSDQRVVAALQYHRRVFLSQQEARVGFKPKWGGLGTAAVTKLGGIVPRLRGNGFSKLSVPGEVMMDYESLVQIGDGPLDILRIQQSGSAAERDLFTSLRGFQLHSRVHVKVKADSNRIRVTFVTWYAQARDRYDFDYNEFLTMPNPDYGGRDGKAVRPMDKFITVYHANARRMEQARLAAPYDVRSQPWAVIDPVLTAGALVTL